MVMQEIILEEHEHIDDLLTEEYKIIQSSKFFSFSTDAVLLADFARTKRIDRIIDLGTGGGVIPLLLKAKGKAAQVEALELQEPLVNMAKRTMRLNKVESDIIIRQGDICQIEQYYAAQSFDAVVSNPPYFPVTKNINHKEAVAIAKHEIKMTLNDVVRAAAYLLKNGGKFFLVHRPDRLTDIFIALREQHLEPKRMCLVYPREGSQPNLVLLESGKNVRPGLKIEAPLVIYDQHGAYTQKLQKIYFGGGE